jgi:protease-4
MGDVAASGGYYIACNADKIFAEATTITGSIGVFGTLPNGKDLADKMGINAEQVKTNKNAVTYSFFEPLSEEQRAFIKEGINDVYELFTQRVADGREGLTQDDVKAIAQGRVWTGSDALNNGLVDELGGLDDALKYAAELAEIEDYRIKELPVYEKTIEELVEGFGLIKSKESILEEELGVENYKILKEIKTMTEQKGVQLLFPFNTEIK